MSAAPARKWSLSELKRTCRAFYEYASYDVAQVRGSQRGSISRRLASRRELGCYRLRDAICSRLGKLIWDAFDDHG